MRKIILALALLSAPLMAQTYTLPADRTPNGTTGGWVTGFCHCDPERFGFTE